MGTDDSKTFGFGTATLIVSDEEMQDITKVINHLKDLSVLLKGVSKTIGKWNKRTKLWILRMLLGALTTTLLGDMLSWLAGKSVKGEEIIREGLEFSFHLILKLIWNANIWSNWT